MPGFRATTCTLLAAGLATLCGCSSASEEPVGLAREAVAHPGPWEIPADTLAIGDTQYVNYTAAGPWLGPSGCYGSLTPGTAILRKYLLDHFQGISSIGGYSCDQGVVHPENMGIHGSGRAIDVMIPLYDGDADNDVGDPIGNFLIENAQLIGVQYIIWDQKDWVGSHKAGDKAGDYTGTSNPHKNHLHIELSVETSENTTNWFEDKVVLPEAKSCAVAANGALIDDSEPCLQFFGNAAYWRVEPGVGYNGGGLHWTNAYESDSPGNWARWNLEFAEAGSYRLEVYLEPAFAVASGVHYEVTDVSAVVDQSSGDGWLEIGTFDFAAGQQSIEVLDNQPVAVPDDQHIAVDALRLTRTGLSPSIDSGTAGDAGAGAEPGADASVEVQEAGDVEAGDEESRKGMWVTDSGGGCSTGRKADWGWWLVAALAAGAVGRRRR